MDVATDDEGVVKSPPTHHALGRCQFCQQIFLKNRKLKAKSKISEK